MYTLLDRKPVSGNWYEIFLKGFPTNDERLSAINGENCLMCRLMAIRAFFEKEA